MLHFTLFDWHLSVPAQLPWPPHKDSIWTAVRRATSSSLETSASGRSSFSLSLYLFLIWFCCHFTWRWRVVYGRSIICMMSTTELIGNLSRELCRQRTKSTVFGLMILEYHDPFVMSTRHGLHINQVHLSTWAIVRHHSLCWRTWQPIHKTNRCTCFKVLVKCNSRCYTYPQIFMVCV